MSRKGNQALVLYTSVKTLTVTLLKTLSFRMVKIRENIRKDDILGDFLTFP